METWLQGHWMILENIVAKLIKLESAKKFRMHLVARKNV
jgi:hypothetical protein